MDETKIRKNPPRFLKQHSLSSFRKKHKDESYWAQQEVIDRFASKYLPEVKSGEIQVLVKGNEVLMSYPDSLNEAMGEFELNPIAAAERFVSEAVEVAISPTDKPMNKEKIVPNPPRWAKPITKAKLSKILSKEPNYFNK